MANTQTPVGLLLVQDVLTRVGKRRQEVIEYEITRRESERLMYRNMLGLNRFHLWSVVRSTAVAGVIVFLLAFMVGGIANLAQMLERLQKNGISLPSVLGATLPPIDVHAYIPQTAFLTYATHLPLWGAFDALRLALIIMIALLAWRAWRGFRVWKQSKLYYRMLEELEEELGALREWKSLS
jgi:hypothetical protein